MKRTRKFIIIGMALMLYFLFFSFAAEDEKEKKTSFYVEITTDGMTERLFAWEDENGDYYVFLPGYADLAKATIRLNTSGTIAVDGTVLSDGMTCGGFLTDHAYDMTVDVWCKKQDCQLTFVQSANVATMFIDTASGCMDYIHAEKGNEEAGKIRLYTAGGQLNYEGELESINGRGNATWQYQEKKPYSLKLSTEADLLHMGAAQKWILLANANDASNLRNKIVYDFADEAGLAYSPDTQWADLYLNGEYAGLYLLSERNEIHPERVDISPETGYLISLELEERLITQKYSYIKTKAEQTLRIHNPQTIEKNELHFLSVLFQSVENALMAEDGIDHVTGKGWQELIDLDSWARMYLIEEMFADNDGGFMSQYFYVKDNKVYAGPVWDFDVCMGSEIAWQFELPNAFYTNRQNVRDTNQTPWFYYFYQKEEAYYYLMSIFKTDVQKKIKVLLEDTINEYAVLIKKADELNRIRWGLKEPLKKDEEQIVRFMTERIAFLNSVWCENEKYYTVHAVPGNNAYHAYYSVFPGECLTSLHVLQDSEYQTFLGWYYADTDEPFDSTRPITEDIEIYAKWADSSYKRKEQILKLTPLAIIACMGAAILWADIRRSRKGG